MLFGAGRGCDSGVCSQVCKFSGAQGSQVCDGAKSTKLLSSQGYQETIGRPIR